jgi:adenine/guanine phosphoribosyltransferase-like PRPP-binding protein
MSLTNPRSDWIPYSEWHRLDLRPKPERTFAMNRARRAAALTMLLVAWSLVPDHAEQRIKSLAGAFEVDATAVRDKQILLVDDLYRSGATATLVAKALLTAGAKAVSMLAMTKTRTRT